MNLDRICENNTPLTVQPYVLDDKDGDEVMVAVAKLSWRLSPEGDPRIAIPSRIPRMMSERGSDERLGAIDYPSDRVDFKPGTDVVLVGSAYPLKEGATEQVVTLRVGAEGGIIEKSVKVHGPRRFVKALRGVSVGKSEPLAVTPLVYGLAYGGTDTRVDPPLIEWQNPVGRGVLADQRALIGEPAFVIEPVGGHEPAGFGPIDDSWSPRLERAGTYDDKWTKTRAPLRPRDFDVRHHAAAHPDLWSEAPLRGNEVVEITGATPEGLFRFRLPPYAPKFEVMIDDVITPLETHLDTFLIDLIDPEWRVVELTWRASVVLPRKTERLQSIAIEPDGRLPDDIYDKLNEDLEAYASQAQA